MVAALFALAAVAAPEAHAERAHVDRIEQTGDHELTMYVYSAAMDRIIEQDVLIPEGGGAGRPTLYLLPGAAGGNDEIAWQEKTDLLQFAAGTGLTIVIPRGGAASYYTDWQRDDPVLGRNKWTTYLTAELPAIIDATFHTSGRNALIGLSMSGTSALALVESAPHRYEAVGAFSGCAETSTPLGQAYVVLTTEFRGGGNVENMWGPLDGPGWTDNDPYLHAERLRGQTIFLSSGTGIPGVHDTLDDPRVAGSVPALVNQILQGGAIELATAECTRRLADRLAALGIPATYRTRPGSHSWGYWQDDLHEFWPIMTAAIGA